MLLMVQIWVGALAPPRLAVEKTHYWGAETYVVSTIFVRHLS
jgi:hypothetical protein